MTSELESRIRILEEKHEYQDNTVEQLNQVVIHQQAQIDAMQVEITKLRKEVTRASVDQDMGNEPPPHY